MANVKDTDPDLSGITPDQWRRMGELANGPSFYVQILLAAILIFFSMSVLGQDVITRDNFDPQETYILQHPIGSYIHTKGYRVATILVKAQSTGVFYRVAIRQEYLDGMKPGDEVEIEPTDK